MEREETLFFSPFLKRHILCQGNARRERKNKTTEDRKKKKKSLYSRQENQQITSRLVGFCFKFASKLTFITLPNMLIFHLEKTNY